MHSRRALDLTPLTRRGALGARLRVVASNTLLVIALTLGVLLVLLPGIGLAGVLLLGDGPVDRGLVVFLVMLLLGGVYVVIDAFAKAGTGTRLQEFARANDLEVTLSLGARHYAGSQFRSGRRIVLHSVRTRRPPVLEVGDSWPLTRVRTRIGVTTHVVTAKNAPEAKVFLRAVLPGTVRRAYSFDGASGSRDVARIAGRDTRFMTTEIDDALHEFAGDYTLEVTGDELTVMGTRPLEPTRPDRVETAFALIDVLAARAGTVLVDQGSIRPAPGRSPQGARPVAGRRRAGRHPLVIVGAVLAMLIVVPLAIALVMSSIDGVLRGREGLATIVVGLMLPVLFWLVARLMRWLTARRDPAPPSRGSRGELADTAEEGSGRRTRRRGLLLAGGLVLLLALGGGAWFAVSQGGADPAPEDSMAGPEECAPEDSRCQWEVSQRIWAQEHGLTRAYPLVRHACELTSDGRSACHLYIECEGGEAPLLAVYEGDPWAVIGVRPLNSGAEEPLATTDEEAARLVAESCR